MNSFSGPNLAVERMAAGAARLHIRALARGLALFLGGFSLLNLVGNVRSNRFDANLWWIDLRWLPSPLAQALLLIAALCLVAFGLRPPRSTWRKRLTLASVGLLGAAALVNTVQFYTLLARGAFWAGIPVPLSLFVSAALGLIFAALWQGASLTPERGQFLPVAGVALACAVGFPLLQMVCFGKTDYRRAGDAVVVLGARVYADGRLSDALADRVRTACQLYTQGWAGKLILSGGPGDGAVHETDAMKTMARRLGVKEEDIFVDRGGVNTQATVRDTEPIFARLHASRILVVSHFYHLPRIKLTYQRDGWDVFTVPAHESYWLRQMPYNMLREVAALWVYYLRALAWWA